MLAPPTQCAHIPPAKGGRGRGRDSLKSELLLRYNIYVIRKIIFGVVALVAIVGLYGAYKPLPNGLTLESQSYTVPNSSIDFFSDRTYIDKGGVRHSDQQIFDEAFRMIKNAETYILLDMFFFSDFLGTATTSHRQLSKELTDLLIEKKTQKPDIVIQVITDPINSMYGGYTPDHFKDLERAGISVITTNLIPLRDSNPVFSALWRTFFRWLPDQGLGDIVPNALDARKPNINIVSYLNSFNFKANHRKVLMTDDARERTSGFSVLITSANPHDGSSAHSNTAIRVDDNLWQDVLRSERVVARFSDANFIEPSKHILDTINERNVDVRVQLLTERAIEKKILELLAELGSNDEFDMAMFYLSDRDIVRALKQADERGVKIRLLLDPNKDAFGREKNGIPNRQVAHELAEYTNGNTTIRWCDTHGEQCHSKLLIFKKNGANSIIQGSANLTRRNLDNLNLETNVLVSGDAGVRAINDAMAFFNASWNNTEGKTYSTDYETYAGTSIGKTLWYRFGEFTGMSRY